MKGRWKLGEPFGIGVYLHWTFAILVFLILIGSFGVGVAEGLLLIAALFGCVVLHELGHSLAARRYGIGTRDITLYPIGGVASLDRMPKEPMKELVIALAGPAVNVVIAMVLFPLVFVAQVVSPALAEFLLQIAVLNVGLVVFNMLPSFPMDGGRVFRALLSMKTGRVRATNVAATVGKVMAVIFGVLGLLSGEFMLVFIALFVWFAGESERRMVEAEAQLGPDGFGFGRFGPVFYQFRHTPSGGEFHPGATSQDRPSTDARDAEWEVLPPERGFRAPRFGAQW